MESTHERPDGELTHDVAPDRPSGYVLAERNKLALWAILSTSMSVLSLMCIVAVIPLLNRSGPDTGARATAAGVVAIVLLGGFVVGALTGHVLGLIAYSDPRVRSGEQPGRGLAMTSVVAGVLLLLACVLLSVITGGTFASAIANL